MKNQHIVVIGANSGIAKAIVKQYINNQNTYLSIVSRDISPYENIANNHRQLIKLKHYCEAEIDTAIAKISSQALPITKVFICHGILHSATLQPEKKLEDFNHQSFMEVITANTLTPMLWLQKLTPIIIGKTPCVVAVFSARVGSGWYSYRASKSALNMLLKTAAIELARRAKNVKLLAFHPGTTDTELSKPFQKKVPANKLFTCEFVAKQLINIMGNLVPNGELSYIDWQGKVIKW